MLLLSYNDALTKKKGRLVMTCARVHTLLHECTNAQATHACTCAHAKTYVNHANAPHTQSRARALTRGQHRFYQFLGFILCSEINWDNEQIENIMAQDPHLMVSDFGCQHIHTHMPAHSPVDTHAHTHGCSHTHTHMHIVRSSRRWTEWQEGPKHSGAQEQNRVA